MEKAVHDSIASLGEDVIYVHKWPWGLNMNIDWWDIMKWPAISTKDYDAIIKRSAKVETACLQIAQGEKIKYRNNLASDAVVAATTHEFENVRSFEISSGRYFTPEESASGKNVAILGAEIAGRIFEKTDPLGKQIYIAGKRTDVIGIFKKEGKGGLTDSGMDEVTLIPLNFGKTFINLKK